MDRTWVGLRAWHEGLDAHIHRQAALHAPQHAAGNHQLFLISLFQVVPDTQAPLKLFDRNQAFRLVAEIHDDVFGGNTEDRALQNFVRGRGREMAVIVEKILVIVGDFLFGWLIVRVYGHYASASH